MRETLYQQWCNNRTEPGAGTVEIMVEKGSSRVPTWCFKQAHHILRDRGLPHPLGWAARRKPRPWVLASCSRMGLFPHPLSRTIQTLQVCGPFLKSSGCFYMKWWVSSRVGVRTDSQNTDAEPLPGDSAWFDWGWQRLHGRHPSKACTQPGSPLALSLWFWKTPS